MANTTGPQPGGNEKPASLIERRRSFSVRTSLLSMYSETPRGPVSREHKEEARRLFFAFSGFSTAAKKRLLEAGKEGPEYTEELEKIAIYLYLKDFFKKAFSQAFEKGTYRDAALYITVFSSVSDFFARGYFQKSKERLGEAFATFSGAISACADAYGMEALELNKAAEQYLPQAERFAGEVFSKRH